MKSLKKKFGKFAVSNEKMSKLTGGQWVCWDTEGYTYHYPAGWDPSPANFVKLIEDGLAIDGCSN